MIQDIELDVETHRVLNFFAEEDSYSPKSVKKHNPPEGGYKREPQYEAGDGPPRKDFALYTSQSRVELRLAGKNPLKSFAQREGFGRLIAYGLKVINDHVYKLKGEMISDEELSYQLYKYLPEAYRGNGLGFPKDVDREVTRAVAKIREYWDADFYPRVQERARAAGSKGKKYDVNDFLETRNMNVSQAARHLGVSRPTVYAMRQEYKGIDLETGEIHDG